MLGAIRIGSVALIAMLWTIPALGQTGPNAERLRVQVVERLLQSMKVQAGLSDEQFDQVRQNIRSTMQAREDHRRRERELWQGIEAQLRPGTAADEAELSGLLDALLDLQTEFVSMNRQQQTQLAEFLNPVQRAVVIRSLTRLERQVEEMVRRRMGAGRPGVRNP